MKKATTIIISVVILMILLTGSLLTGAYIGYSFSSDIKLAIGNPSTDSSIPSEVPQTSTPELPSNHPPLPESQSISDNENLDILFSPFWEAWNIVHDQFVDQPLDDDALIAGAIHGMIAAQGNGISGTNGPHPVPNIDDTGTPEDFQELFIPFWNTWTSLHAPDDQILMQGAITGMMDALGDQHSSYMSPDQFRQANIPMEGDYEGIGAWVDPTQEYLTVVSPMPGSPAEAVGLLPGDEVIAIDGDDMTGIDGNLVIRRVLGPANSKVVLTIRREGVDEPFDVEITRARIFIPSVEHSMLENDLGYVNVMTFGDDTTKELRIALEELLAQNPEGLILDLRNNGGGFLITAIEVASEFLSDGIIIYEEYGDGSRKTFEAFEGGLATEIPLVVLINEGTASASEIVSGAIQDYGRAFLVGNTSFGKGSVQNWIPLENEQGAVRVTIARWLTPNERQIHEIGLTPDYQLAMISQAAIDAGFDPTFFELPAEQIFILSAEDIQADRDPQLEKAIEVLLEQINH
ncbi:MAG: S41 family peptidase [Chloroflexi bacterium]|nr:S41 family peptidase [Chloroflexota bacterium]